MKIIFVVNTTGLTGGMKVVFELANRLARMGHTVEIIHLLRLKQGFFGLAEAWLKKIKRIVLQAFGQDKIDWFALENNVIVKHLIKLDPIVAADALIATANETAQYVYEAPVKANKYYFVQDYEEWTRERNKVDATYRLPLLKFTTCKHLQELFQEKLGVNIPYMVFYGLNYHDFSCPDKEYHQDARILMLYHILRKKGFTIGLKAFKEASEMFPKTTLKLFGAYPLPKEISKNIPYYFQPDKKTIKQLYCEADIFIFPSIYEGFGIPPMEAMAAGCAVIATDTGAVREYAVSGKTVLIVPPNDQTALTKTVQYLLTNKETRISLGQAAKEYIKKFTWQSAAEQLEEILSKKEL